MESQPQNPEFRNNPENFHPQAYSSYICEHPYIQIQGLFTYEKGENQFI